MVFSRQFIDTGTLDGSLFLEFPTLKPAQILVCCGIKSVVERFSNHLDKELAAYRSTTNWLVSLWEKESKSDPSNSYSSLFKTFLDALYSALVGCSQVY